MLQEVAEWVCENIDLGVEAKRAYVDRRWPGLTDADLDAASMIAVMEQRRFRASRLRFYQTEARRMEAANDGHAARLKDGE